MNSIDFNGHIFDVHHFTGTVTSLNIRPPIFPVTLRADNGKEHIIQTTDIPSFACSKGNKLKVIWVEIPSDITFMNGNTMPTCLGDKRTFYLATKNYTTDQVLIYDRMLGQFFSSAYTDYYVLPILAFFPICFIIYLCFKSLIISCLISIAICFFMGKASYKSKIKAEKFVIEAKRNLLLML
jgi:hypothetical protein